MYSGRISQNVFAVKGFLTYTRCVKAPETRAELIAFAFDVGMAIAGPLAVFAFIGRTIDKSYDTSPLFLIIGLLLSLVSTGIIIWKKVKHFL